MSRSHLLLLIVGAVGAVTLVAAQQPVAPQATTTPVLAVNTPQLVGLEVRDTKVLPRVGATLIRALSCDAEGNPYFASGDSFDDWVVNRWDLHDNKLIPFATGGNPELRGFLPQRVYGVAPDGGVYMPVWKVPEDNKKRPEQYLAKFAKDGSLAGKIKIERDLSIFQLAVFPSGDFLALAFKPQWRRMNPEPPREYVTAIFRANGEVIKELTEEVDPAVKDGIKSRDPMFTNPELAAANDRTIETGAVSVGPDGFVYAMRRERSAVIRVYSPGGELIHKYRVEPPAGEMRPAWFQVGEGSVAVYFIPEGRGSGAITVADSQTGEVKASFDGRGHSQAFACFAAPNSFTMLSSTPQGQLSAEVLR